MLHTNVTDSVKDEPLFCLEGVARMVKNIPGMIVWLGFGRAYARRSVSLAFVLIVLVLSISLHSYLKERRFQASDEASWGRRAELAAAYGLKLGQCFLAGGCANENQGPNVLEMKAGHVYEVQTSDGAVGVLRFAGGGAARYRVRVTPVAPSADRVLAETSRFDYLIRVDAVACGSLGDTEGLNAIEGVEQTRCAGDLQASPERSVRCHVEVVSRAGKV